MLPQPLQAILIDTQRQTAASHPDRRDQEQLTSNYYRNSSQSSIEMHLQCMSLMALLAAFVSTSPLRPSPKAYHFARDISLQEVDADMTGPAPGWALTSAGLAKRGKLITCQPDDDDGQTGLTKKGDKNWVPVDQWLASGSEFCSDRSGLINQIPQSQSQTFSGYAVTLTNQKSPADVGDPGHIACESLA